MVAILGVLLDVFGSYTQLEKWDSITDRADISKFADLFVEDSPDECKDKGRITI